MTAIDTAEAPYVVGTRPPPERGGSLARTGYDNPFENIPLAAYEQPVWRQPSPFFRAYMINDPAGLKRVLIDNVANYPKTDVENRLFRATLGDGLLSSEGETWRTHRRVMAPSFDPRSVAGYAEAMVEATRELVDRWAQMEPGTELDASAAMTRLTLEIICRTMFSAEGGEMAALTGSAFDRAADAFGFSLLDIMPIIAGYRLKRRERMMGEIFAPLDGAIRKLVEGRSGESDKLDLLGRLVSAMDEETGARLTPKEVRDEVLTIFAAGHETTASAMSFTWYALSQFPEWEAKLHAELDGVLGGRAPTGADIPNLPLTRRILDESMRLYPPAPGLSARVAKADDELAGVKIRKGSMVMVSSWVLHRHRQLWDNPERFDPDRFLPERSVGRPRFAYMPFGGGPRVCIGQQLALTEATLMLATLAQRFRLRLKPGHQVKIVQRVTIRPLGGLPMILEPRT